MDHHARLRDEDVTRIEHRMAQALAALEEFFAAAREDREFTDRVRVRATAARTALAEARGEWPHIVEDWRHLRERIVALMEELGRLEELVGELTRSLEEEVWPPES